MVCSSIRKHSCHCQHALCICCVEGSSNNDTLFAHSIKIRLFHLFFESGRVYFFFFVFFPLSHAEMCTKTEQCVEKKKWHRQSTEQRNVQKMNKHLPSSYKRSEWKFGMNRTKKLRVDEQFRCIIRTYLIHQSRDRLCFYQFLPTCESVCVCVWNVSAQLARQLFNFFLPFFFKFVRVTISILLQ